MPGRILSPKEQEKFFEMLGDPKDLDAKHICDLFARHRNSPPEFYVEDILTIGPEHSPYVAPNSKTTIGIYLVNKFIFEDMEIFGYINSVITDKTQGKIDSAIATALMDGELTTQQYAEYVDRCQYLYGGPMGLIINPSVDEMVFSLPPGAKKLRAQLLEEHKEELEANDPQAAAKIEKQVVNAAMAEMRAKNPDDPSLALFDSGCGVDAYNNYKTIFVMKGAIADNTGESPTGYKIVTSNYDTGVTKDDMHKIADTVVTSSYSTGVATQDSGASGKKINALFSAVRVQEQGSDCKSTQYLEMEIDSRYLYRWVLDGSKLVMITRENLDKYKGKRMKIRSGCYCKATYPEYCSKCVGDRPYRVGIRNIGSGFMSVSGSTLNASLKKKHDISIKLQHIGVKELMKYVK